MDRARAGGTRKTSDSGTSPSIRSASEVLPARNSLPSRASRRLDHASQFLRQRLLAAAHPGQCSFIQAATADGNRAVTLQQQAREALSHGKHEHAGHVDQERGLHRRQSQRQYPQPPSGSCSRATGTPGSARTQAISLRSRWPAGGAGWDWRGEPSIPSTARKKRL